MTRRWDYSYTPGIVGRAFGCCMAVLLALLALGFASRAVAQPSGVAIATAVLWCVMTVTGLTLTASWVRHSRTLRPFWIEIGPEAVSWAKTRFVVAGLRTEHDHVPLEAVRGVNFLHDSDGECVWLLRHDGCDRVLTVLHRDWADFAETLRARLPEAVVLENGKTPTGWPLAHQR